MEKDRKRQPPSQDISTTSAPTPQQDHIPEDATSIESSGGVVEPEAGAAGIRELL
jgi:hypothetical protein